MNLYSSKTPRDLNHDPEPFVYGFDASRRVSADDAQWESRVVAHRPRPEFDHEQHNEPNPILVALREREGRDRLHYVRGFLAHRPEGYFWPNWSQAHVTHARRVLTRLAALGEVQR